MNAIAFTLMQTAKHIMSSIKLVRANKRTKKSKRFVRKLPEVPFANALVI